MNAVGVVVADGTAAGGFSVKGLAEELEAAELEVAVPDELGATEEEAALLALETALVAIEVAVLATLVREEMEEEAS